MVQVNFDPVKVAQIMILRNAGIIQEDMSDLLGISQATVSRYVCFIRAVGLGLVVQRVPAEKEDPSEN